MEGNLVREDEGYGPLTAMHAEVFQTGDGTRYLREPGVMLLNTPYIPPFDVSPFLKGMDPDFLDYLTDFASNLPDAVQIAKTAGQICYLSFGPKRTKNEEARKYFDNILESGHFSILRHAHFSFIIYGISRSLSHELVRHSAGVDVSQLSQRYVGMEHLRFVERPEFQDDDYLHDLFVSRIDQSAYMYARLQHEMVEYIQRKRKNSGYPVLTKTDARKAANQAARASLPNETETAMVFTANVLALRHIFRLRGARDAEPEIRRLAKKLYMLVEPFCGPMLQDVRLFPIDEDRGDWGVDVENH